MPLHQLHLLKPMNEKDYVMPIGLAKSSHRDVYCLPMGARLHDSIWTGSRLSDMVWQIWQANMRNPSNPTFQVARPITCPNGEMAGVTTGSKVIGSISLGRGFVSSTVRFPSSPHRFLYLSVRLTADHLYDSKYHTQISSKSRPNQQPTTAQRTEFLL